MKAENHVSLEFAKLFSQRGLCPHGGGLLCRPAGPHAGGGKRCENRRQRGGDQRHCPRLPRYHRKDLIKLRIREDHSLEVVVRDWGVGIEDVEQARTPLFTTGSEERSGMGFTIMESFMDTLRVRSAPGKGTTVTMRRKIARRAGR